MLLLLLELVLQEVHLLCEHDELLLKLLLNCWRLRSLQLPLELRNLHIRRDHFGRCNNYFYMLPNSVHAAPYPRRNLISIMRVRRTANM